MGSHGVVCFNMVSTKTTVSIIKFDEV